MRRTSLFLLAAAALALPACEPHDEPDAARSILEPAFAHVSAGWGPAVALVGIDLNTAALEGCPSESPDGRSLYFATNRDNNLDIYVTHRQSNGEWGAPEPLVGVNSGAAEFCPAALPGGRLLFVSDRNEAGQNCGVGADIYQTRLDPVTGWQPPEHLGCVINSPRNEFSPSWVAAAGGMLFFSSDRESPGAHAIYVSSLEPDGTWQTPQPVSELNAGGVAFRPNVSQDGREIVFDSNRAGSLQSDIWYAHRPTPHSAWSAPVRIEEPSINSAGAESRPWLSQDGRRLYFGSARGGQSSDLYVAERR